MLQKTYTSYAIAIPHEENEALGRDGRRAVKDRLRALVPQADLIEFDDSDSESSYLYLRFAVEDDTPERHALIQTILVEEINAALDAAPTAPGMH